MMPERIDAVMRIEAPVLDGDEGLGHIARQFVQRHRCSAHVAAGGECCAVGAEDQNRWRTLGNFQRLDRRQMDADPDQRCRSRRSGPRVPERRPSRSDGQCRSGLCRAEPAAACFCGAAPSRWRRPVLPRVAAGRRCGRPGAGGGRRRGVSGPVAARSVATPFPSPANASESQSLVFGNGHAQRKDGREAGLRGGYWSPLINVP